MASSASSPTEAGRGAGTPAGAAVIATAALGAMLAPLNSTMIGVALPRIGAAFAVGPAALGWLVIAYLLAMAGLQPAAGTLGDRLGRRRLVLGGLGWFAAASLGAALAPSFPVLVCWRVQQALAGALLTPNGMALVREVVPAGERARRFGQIGAAIAGAAAVGPPLGGLLVGAGSWRAVFAANVVLIVPALVIGRRSLPAPGAAPPAGRFDLAGALWLTALLSAAAGLLSRAADLARLPALAITALLVALAGATVGFVRRALRHPAPALQPRLFAERAFAAATAANALSNLAMYTALLALPLLLARQGWGSGRVGFLLAGMSLGNVALAPLGGRLADRLGRRWPAVLGLAVLGAGGGLLALDGGAGSVPPLLGGLILIGGGLGLASAALQTGALEAAPRALAGAASGVYSTSRYLGSIVGAALLGAALGAAPGAGGFRAIFVLIAAAGVASALAALGLRDRPAADDGAATSATREGRPSAA